MRSRTTTSNRTVADVRGVAGVVRVGRGIIAVETMAVQVKWGSVLLDQLG